MRKIKIIAESVRTKAGVAFRDEIIETADTTAGKLIARGYAVAHIAEVNKAPIRKKPSRKKFRKKAVKKADK